MCHVVIIGCRTPQQGIVIDHFVSLLHLQQIDDNGIVIADDDVNSCDVYLVDSGVDSLV